MCKEKILDQFYTKKDVSSNCYNCLLEIYNVPKSALWIEPSVGTGAFGDLIIRDNRELIAIDLEPKVDYALTHDYLTFKLNTENDFIITIGNPPFGKRSSLAIDFVNKAFNDGSKIVAFIVPLQFRKWSVQSKINKNAKLVFDMDLNENSFEFKGSEYSVRCCFQIWSVINDDKDDLRIKEKPAVTHKDFEIYQYNRVEESKKFFDYDWDFCVVRQGYYDFNELIFDKSKCNEKRQYIFFKAKNKRVLNRLKKLDFKKLSLNNTSIPGFGKADVIREYQRIYEGGVSDGK